MRKAVSLSVFLLILWGCTALSPSYKRGTEAALSRDWDRAIQLYERATLENPSNRYYRLALIRAKVMAGMDYASRARNLVLEGKKEEALAVYQKALSYDPANLQIAREAAALVEEEPLEQLDEEELLQPPIKLKAPSQPVTLKIGDGSLQAIFQALSRFGGINILFDEQFTDRPFSVDIADSAFEEALASLCLAAKCFYRIVNEKTVIIVPDRPDKRLQYEWNAIKTFYLSNISAEEVSASLIQLLRTQFKGPSIFVDKNLNSVTVRDVPEVVSLAGRILKLWDKPRGEVVIDLEIMEVSRQTLRKMGLDLDAHVLGFAYSGTPAEGQTGWYGLKGIDFGNTENFMVSLPTAILQFLETDVDTKMIAQPRLRGVENETMTYLVGDQIPVPTTTFTPIAAGGVSQQPVTSFEYKDVGIDLKFTPRIHLEGEVTLDMEIKIKALGGTGYADLPIITTREVKNIIRLKNGETNLLAGLLKDEERKTKKGIIGLRSIPLLGELFSSTDQKIQQTDVIMTITPYIIRSIPLTEEDRKPFWINLEGVTAGTQTPEELGDVPFTLDMEAEDMRIRAERAREAAGQNLVSLVPPDLEIPPNREFRLNVTLRSQENIGNLSLGISFNGQVLEIRDVEIGDILTREGQEVPFMKNIDNTSGICTIGFSSTDPGRGLRGSGRLASLVIVSKEPGESPVSVSSVSAISANGRPIAFESRNARIRVR